MNLNDIFSKPIQLIGNHITILDGLVVETVDTNQLQTKDIFSEKWKVADEYEKIDKLYKFQFE